MSMKSAADLKVRNGCQGARFRDLAGNLGFELAISGMQIHFAICDLVELAFSP